MTKTKISQMNMTEGPLLGKIILYSVPLVITGMLQLAYNAADTIVLGRYAADGETAVAAVGSCGALINLIIQLFMGLSVGVGVLIAQDIGAKRHDEVRKTIHTAIPTAAILGVIVAIFGFFAAKPLLILTGVEETVLAEAVPYMKAYMLGMPASMVYNYCAAILRSSGDTAHPLLFLSISGIINVFFNLFVVLVLKQGAVSIGITTAIASWLSMIMILVFMVRSKGLLHVNFKELHIYKDKLIRMILIGIPAGLQGCVFSLSNVIIQSAVNSFGKTVVAGSAVAANIGNFVYTATNSFYHTTLIFVGQNVGAKKFDRVREIIIKCSVTAMVTGVLVGGITLIFGRQLIGIFVPGNTAAIEAGMIRLVFVSSTYFLCGIMEVGCGAMRGMGNSLIPMIVSVVGSCVMRIVWIYTVFAAFPTLSVLYLSYPISWALTAVAHYICAGIRLRQLKRAHDLSGRTPPGVSPPNLPPADAPPTDVSATKATAGAR